MPDDPRDQLVALVLIACVLWLGSVLRWLLAP
jgi:hypothetical protein